MGFEGVGMVSHEGLVSGKEGLGLVSDAGANCLVLGSHGRCLDLESVSLAHP